MRPSTLTHAFIPNAYYIYACRAHIRTANAHNRDRRGGLSTALLEDFITVGDSRAVANVYDYP